MIEYFLYHRIDLISYSNKVWKYQAEKSPLQMSGLFSIWLSNLGSNQGPAD